MREKGTFIQEHRGASIYVDGEGKFIAEYQGKEIRKRALNDVKKEINKRAQAIRVFYLHRKEVHVAEVIDVDRNDHWKTKDGSTINRYLFHTYLYDEEIVGKLKDIEERWNEFEKQILSETYDLIERAVKINPEMLGQHEDQKTEVKE